MTATVAPLDVQTRALLELMQERVDGLVDRIAERAYSVYGADAGHDIVPREEIAATTDALARVAISALLDQRPPSGAELAQASAVGELRARQGITLDTLLRGFRVAAREGLATIHEIAVSVDLDMESTVTLAAALWDWIDDMSVEVAEGHRHVELALARRDQQQRAAFVNGLVRGNLAPHRLADGVAAFKLDPDAAYVVVRARTGDEHDAERVEHLLLPSTWSAGLAAVIDDDVVAVLPSAPATDLPVPAGVGPPAPLGGLARSYRLAGRALETAVAFSLTGCHGIEGVSLRAAVLADPDVGAVLATRYLEPLAACGAFGEEILHSLRAYMAAGQNIESAAHELIVHPNTLRHRLRRFEEESGGDLHDLDTLAEVWWALRYDEIRRR